MQSTAHAHRQASTSTPWPARKERWLLALAGHPEAPAAICKTAIVVLAHINHDHGSGWPSQSRLAELTHQGVSTVRHHLDWLRDHGFLRSAIRNNRSFKRGLIYVFVDAAGPDLADASSRRVADAPNRPLADASLEPWTRTQGVESTREARPTDDASPSKAGDGDDGDVAAVRRLFADAGYETECNAERLRAVVRDVGLEGARLVLAGAETRPHWIKAKSIGLLLAQTTRDQLMAIGRKASAGAAFVPDDPWLYRVVRWAHQMDWDECWGPRPGQAGCKAQFDVEAVAGRIESRFADPRYVIHCPAGREDRWQAHIATVVGAEHAGRLVDIVRERRATAAAG